MMKTVGFHTLGCKVNFSETDTLARLFRERGYAIQPDAIDAQTADVVVINTCSVTDNADKKCRKLIRQARKHNPNAHVLVVGCYAQLKPKEIAEIPGVTAVLGAAEKFRIVDILETLPDAASCTAGAVFQQPIEATYDFVPSFSLEGRTRAFLKIQDGCDYRCSFCTIPLARGRSRSQPLPDILCSIERLAERGICEVVLSGINLGDYGKGLPEPEAGQPCAYSFLEVVRAISLADLPVRRFRISSIEPNLLTDSIIQAVAQSPVFMPHFHIPLQSGSDTVLAEMRRRYRSGLYAERVASIRHAMPDAAIGVDVIVGFPGESEAEFQRTYDFLAALDVTYFHVFPYSERANTLAAELPSSVPQAVRYARCDALRALSEHKRRAFAARHAGQTRPVLWESQLQDDCLSGYTDNYIRVSRPATEADLAQWANTIELVTLTEVAPDGLVRLPEAVVGELVG